MNSVYDLIQRNKSFSEIAYQIMSYVVMDVNIAISDNEPLFSVVTEFDKNFHLRSYRSLKTKLKGLTKKKTKAQIERMQKKFDKKYYTDIQKLVSKIIESEQRRQKCQDMLERLESFVPKTERDREFKDEFVYELNNIIRNHCRVIGLAHSIKNKKRILVADFIKEEIKNTKAAMEQDLKEHENALKDSAEEFQWLDDICDELSISRIGK